MPRPPEALNALICFDLYKTQLAIGRAYKPLLAPLGLTYAQYLVMIALWDEDEQSIGALGQAVGLDSSTLTPLLKRLEQAGLVRRARDRTDERRVRVTLTAEGQALQARQDGIAQAMATRLGLSDADLKHLRRMLHDMQANLAQG
jgi:DNA-binding MarR family transcriptional regulator